MGEIVKFASNGGTAEGYLAKPAGGAKGPGVIVIQEWWGLNDNIKNIADRFAAEGYLALAPDLYHGKVTAEPDEAGKIMMELKMEEAAKDLSGAYEFLKDHENGTGKVGSVGFCMGGRLSLFVSTLKPIDATVIYYGVMMGEHPDLTKLKGPVLGHYAGNDGWIKEEMVHGLEQKLKDAGKSAEMHIYPGTEHGFFNDTRPEAHAPAESKVTWDRTLAFYDKHLR
jgi:carboxymethylenebutenolidase